MIVLIDLELRSQNGKNNSSTYWMLRRRIPLLVSSIFVCSCTEESVVTVYLTVLRRAETGLSVKPVPARHTCTNISFLICIPRPSRAGVVVAAAMAYCILMASVRVIQAVTKMKDTQSMGCRA